MRTLILLFFLWVPGLPIMAQENCPCCTEAHDDFDFWVGDWEVFLADGSLAGYNTITKEAGDCVLRESWRNAAGNFTGSSLNFYNSREDAWEQLWVDSAGNQLRLQGKFQDGSMVLQGAPQDSGAVNRITWTQLEDGRVRQLWEQIASDTVQRVVFDGYYHPVK